MKDLPKRFGLYLILTRPAAGYDRCAEAAVAAGVRFLQLRMKGEPRAHILETARRIRALTLGTETRFILNDDPELAAEIGADGVHLGQNDAPLPQTRMRHPQLPIWGLSTHDEHQAAAALAIQPTYIGVGPIFATPTKTTPDPVLGLERMGRIIRSTPIPAVAIGGINEANLADVLYAGATNFAVVRAVCENPNPAAAIQRLLEIWRSKDQEGGFSEAGGVSKTGGR